MHLKSHDRWILGIVFIVFLGLLFTSAPHVAFFALASLMWAVYDTLIFHYKDSIFGQSKFINSHAKLKIFFESDWRRYKKSYHGIPDLFVRPFMDAKHLSKTIAVVSFALATPFWISALVMWAFFFNIYWGVFIIKPDKNVENSKPKGKKK